MRIEKSETPGKIRIDCLTCGNLYEVDDYLQDELTAEFMQHFYEHNRCCPECCRQAEAAAAAAEAEVEQARLISEFPLRLITAGLQHNYIHDRQSGELFIAPPCRSIAEFIWLNRRKNLLISGVTGSGKSTGASFVAAKLLQSSRMRIRYRTLSQLLSEWREARCSDEANAASRMLNFYLNLDLLIIDEMAGKAHVSESGKEFLFYLLEAVNSGESRTRIWLLGNFYVGSIEEIFPDGDPCRRRLAENFTCVKIDKNNITPLEVYAGV